MKLDIKRVEVWIAKLKNKPGSLHMRLAPIAAAGADLDFVFARRSPEKPGTGVAFIAPIKGAKQINAAKKAGFKRPKRLFTLRISGPNRVGMGLKITEALAEADLNLQGFSAHVIGNKFVLHIALDTAAAATKAVKVLKKL